MLENNLTPKVGERYNLWDMAVNCLSMTPNGNALFISDDKNQEFFLYKQQFYHLKKAKLSGKKVIVIGRFKESDDIVAFIYSDMNSYRNSNRNPLFITLAIKEIEWEEGEGL